MSQRNELIDLGASLYKDELSNKGMTEIVVPEFDRSFYCPPALDLGQRQKVQTMIKKGDVKLAAQIIVYCARTEENDPLFTDSNVHSIATKWNPKLVDRLGAAFMDIVMPKDESTVDDAIKNSKATKNSTPGSTSQKSSKSQ